MTFQGSFAAQMAAFGLRTHQLLTIFQANPLFRPNARSSDEPIDAPWTRLALFAVQKVVEGATVNGGTARDLHHEMMCLLRSPHSLSLRAKTSDAGSLAKDPEQLVAPLQTWCLDYSLRQRV
jgi:hypothetical protein